VELPEAPLETGVFPPPYIRPIAIALIRRGHEIFVAEGFDTQTQDHFYRALGGGIEFGETSWEGLKREFQEELQAELIQEQYLGCVENLFECYGNPGHEIVFIYECEFADRTLYNSDEMIFSEGDHKKKAKWMAIEDFQAKTYRLVPDIFESFL